MRTHKNCKMYIMNKPQFGSAVITWCQHELKLTDDVKSQIESSRSCSARGELRGRRPHATKRILNWKTKYGLNPTAKSTINSRNTCRLARASTCCYLTTHLSHTTTIAASDTGPEGGQGDQGGSIPVEIWALAPKIKVCEGPKVVPLPLWPMKTEIVLPR